MRKVLLVNSNTERFPYPVPPIGLSILYTILSKDFIVEIFDGVFTPSEMISEVISNFKPDFIGVSIRNVDDMVMDRPKFYIPEIIEKFINPIKAATTAPLILGGSGFSIYPNEILHLTGADYGIVGEAEMSFPLLLNALEKGISPHDIQGVMVKNTSDIVSTSNPSRNHNLQIPFSEIDNKINFKPYVERGVYSIQTKRGCYHQCIYCTYPIIEGKNYRLRSAVEIAKEIEEAYHRLGCVTFEFVDSTFNDPPQHAENICREIIKKGIPVRLRTMGINPAHATAELFELMRKAGFAQVDTTPDSASPKMLLSLKKNFSLAKLQKTAKLIKDFDMPTMWFFLFGGPGEDEHTVNETFEFISQYISPLDMVHMTIGLRIYPGTELHQIALKEKRMLHTENLLKPDYFYVSDNISKNKLQDLLFDFSRKNYNCVPASDSTPPPEMIRDAMVLKEKEKLQEPMFRTLLRIRKKWFEESKMS